MAWEAQQTQLDPVNGPPAPTSPRADEDGTYSPTSEMYGNDSLDGSLPMSMRGGVLKGSHSPRWAISKKAKLILEQIYQMERFPSAEMRRRLAEDFEVEPRQVQFWFQARGGPHPANDWAASASPSARLAIPSPPQLTHALPRSSQNRRQRDSRALKAAHISSPNADGKGQTSTANADAILKQLQMMNQARRSLNMPPVPATTMVSNGYMPNQMFVGGMMHPGFMPMAGQVGGAPIGMGQVQDQMSMGLSTVVQQMPSQLMPTMQMQMQNLPAQVASQQMAPGMASAQMIMAAQNMQQPLTGLQQQQQTMQVQAQAQPQQPGTVALVQPQLLQQPHQSPPQSHPPQPQPQSQSPPKLQSQQSQPTLALQQSPPQQLTQVISSPPLAPQAAQDPSQQPLQLQPPQQPPLQLPPPQPQSPPQLQLQLQTQPQPLLVQLRPNQPQPQQVEAHTVPQSALKLMEMAPGPAPLQAVVTLESSATASEDYSKDLAAATMLGLGMASPPSETPAIATMYHTPRQEEDRISEVSESSTSSS